MATAARWLWSFILKKFIATNASVVTPHLITTELRRFIPVEIKPPWIRAHPQVTEERRGEKKFSQPVSVEKTF